jgi:hypothetical protein
MGTSHLGVHRSPGDPWYITCLSILLCQCRHGELQ